MHTTEIILIQHLSNKYFKLLKWNVIKTNDWYSEKTIPRLNLHTRIRNIETGILF